MPAKDQLHFVVVRCLQKDGWAVAPLQPSLVIGSRRLWVNILAENRNESRLIEVKGFEQPSSPIHYLEESLGQYLLYKSSMQYLDINAQLYLAVPEDAYQGILSEEIAKIALKYYQVKLLVFSPEEERICAWI